MIRTLVVFAISGDSESAVKSLEALYMDICTSCVCLVSVLRAKGSDHSFLGGGERGGGRGWY